MKVIEPTSFAKAYTRLIIEQIFVLEEHRRKGIAKSLFDIAHVAAKQAGLNEVQVMTYQVNTDAQRFYESLGYERQMIQYRKLM